MKLIFIVFVYLFYRPVFAVNVKESPGMIIDVKDIEKGIFIKSGERKIINCTVSGKNVEMEWIKPGDQVVFRDESDHVYSYYQNYHVPRPGSTTLTLVITQASVEDTGYWTCRAEDFVETVSICVIDPIKFEGTLNEVAVDEDRSYTLSCQVQGNPEPSIKWFKDGELISEDGFDSFKYITMKKFNNRDIEGLLTIIRLYADDAGIYTCEATQETDLAKHCSNKDTFNITLKVNQVPVFAEMDSVKTIYAKESQILFINCTAFGYPLPKYQWFIKNGVGLIEYLDKESIDSDTDKGSSILKLKVTTDTYDTQYKCIASNRLGKKEKVYTILKPNEPEKPSQVIPIIYKMDGLGFNVSWDEIISFDSYDVEAQYLPTQNLKKTKKSPNESDWIYGEIVKVPIGEVFEKNLIILLGGLDDNTEYWVRLRVKDEVVVSPWSYAVKARTKERVYKVVTESIVENEGVGNERGPDKSGINKTKDLITSVVEKLPEAIPISHHGFEIFYALLFAISILAAAAGFTFLTRFV